jgi:NhaA family Na+:H+ antiporter
MTERPSPIEQLIAPVRALFVSDASSGILLILVAAAAMLVANSPLHAPYHALFHDALFAVETFKLNTLHLWINDGLMAIFFFVVGLEVKRELIEGQLSSPEQRRLPVLAAVAGMAVPALVYVATVGTGNALTAGWAVPAATDIAFAMGVIGLLGNRVPGSLRLFLLTVAIVDDIGAVVIIALFYTAKVNLMWLAASAVVAAVMVMMNRAKVDRLGAYLLVAAVLWFCILHSGAHPTVAGVIAALVIPMRTRDGGELLAHVEHSLAPWSAYAIVPIFGFANAGVDLRGIGMEGFFAPLPLAIAAGLVLGKQAGILGAVVIAQLAGFAQRPDGASWAQVWGVSILCGIGFTMSLFIGTMGFADNDVLYEQVKIGVLAGSLVSIVLGYCVLRWSASAPEPA